MTTCTGGWEKQKTKFGANYITNDFLGGKQTKRRYPLSTNYCSTHGYDIKPDRHSGNCTNRGEFHNELATINNMLGGYIRNCFHHAGWTPPWWCWEVNTNKVNKNESINYIPSPRPNMSYAAAAVVNNSNNKLYELTSLLSKKKPYGHPFTAATGTFLTQQHSNTWTKLPHKQFGVLCANNTTMNKRQPDSSICCQISLSLYSKGMHSMKWTNHLYWYQSYAMQDARYYLVNIKYN